MSEETFRELIRIRSGVKVLPCSGYSGPSALRSFQGKGMSGFLQKPFRMSDLVAGIRSILETREVVS